jgi:hypothetical protein
MTVVAATSVGLSEAVSDRRITSRMTAHLVDRQEIASS